MDQLTALTLPQIPGLQEAARHQAYLAHAQRCGIPPAAAETLLGHCRQAYERHYVDGSFPYSSDAVYRAARRRLTGHVPGPESGITADSALELLALPYDGQDIWQP
ncbi:hypothetical protein [Streptomyces sp. bgisy029]|uniref:hypothetical protein n=1 Tax=Streptomyces sp. bgisy029 TaxID=3413771 RepID=UPI003D75F978